VIQWRSAWIRGIVLPIVSAFASGQQRQPGEKSSKKNRVPHKGEISVRDGVMERGKMEGRDLITKIFFYSKTPIFLGFFDREFSPQPCGLNWIKFSGGGVPAPRKPNLVQFSRI
jgi:hypothetical protein